MVNILINIHTENLVLNMLQITVKSMKYNTFSHRSSAPPPVLSFLRHFHYMWVNQNPAFLFISPFQKLLFLNLFRGYSFSLHDIYPNLLFSTWSSPSSSVLFFQFHIQDPVRDFIIAYSSNVSIHRKESLVSQNV
jgi:hypothetical protein